MTNIPITKLDDHRILMKSDECGIFQELNDHRILVKSNFQELDDHRILMKFFKDFDQNSGCQP